MKSEHINFTEKTVGALPIPTKEQGLSIYYDTGTTDGLSIRITYGGTKTYYFAMRFQGRTVQFKIGRVGDIKLVDARAKAHTYREQATKGEDPSRERKESLKDITLKQFYENVYKPEYSSVHKKAGSIKNDDSIFNHWLNIFHTRTLLSITSNEIEKLHNKIKAERTPYTANRMLSLIKHMYGIAVKYGYVRIDANPTEFLNKFPEKSRGRFLQSDELKQLFDALDKEPNEVFKNYVLISLFSGIRRNNVLTLRWSNIDFKNGFIYLPETKNGESQQVPMSNQLKELLETMKATANSEWVIPSNKSASGHMEDPKRPWQDLLKRAGIEDLRLHDLRRTQGSYQAITGASMVVIGKSLGHKSQSATAVYARLSVDPVRDAMQRATDKMMELAE